MKGYSLILPTREQEMPLGSRDCSSSLFAHCQFPFPCLPQMSNFLVFLPPWFSSSSQLHLKFLPPCIFTSTKVKYLQTENTFFMLQLVFNFSFSAKRLLSSSVGWDNMKGWRGPITSLAPLERIRKGKVQKAVASLPPAMGCYQLLLNNQNGIISIGSWLGTAWGHFA